jgi:EmrB/QacA subfamily drug resistance transporter
MNSTAVPSPPVARPTAGSRAATSQHAGATSSTSRGVGEGGQGPVSAPVDFSLTGHPQRRTILVVLCLSLLVVVIDNTVLNTALPTLARVLPAGTSALQWITDAYSLCFAALLIPAGALGDRFGRKRSLVAGLSVYAVGSLAASTAGGAHTLIADRVVMGLAAAFVMPATLSILNSVFPPSERPQAIAAWSAVAGVGVVLGPTLGGALLSHFWWGSVFLVNVPLVAIALVGVARVVPESNASGTKRLDVVGTVLAAASLVAIVDAIIEAPDRGWTSALTLGEAALGLTILAGFIARELRSDHPLIDLRVFRSRSVSGAATAVGVIFFALFGSLFALTQYLQLVHGYSPFGAGMRALPFALAMGAVSPISALATKRLGVRLVVAGGLVLMSLGLLALSTVGVHTAYPPLAGFVAIMGAGMGLVMAPASSIIMEAVPEDQAGAGSAVNDTVREVGGSLGIAVVGSIVAALYGHRLGGVMTQHGAPHSVVRTATGSVAAADEIAKRLGGPIGSELGAAAHSAFTSAMGSGMRVAAAVALVGAVVCSWALRDRITAEVPAVGWATKTCPDREAVGEPVGWAPKTCPDGQLVYARVY